MEISHVAQEWCTFSRRLATGSDVGQILVERLDGVMGEALRRSTYIEPDWERRRSEHTEMIEVGLAHLSHASLVFPDTPHLFMICDQEGVVLETIHGPGRLDFKVELGESLSIEHAGRNVVGIAMASGCHTVTLGAAERESADGVVALGLTLRSETGVFEGVVGCVVPTAHGAPSNLRHLFCTALGIERELIMLKRMRQQRREQYISDLAGKAVHEVRNPLTAMRAAAQLGRLIDDPAKRGELFDRIVGEIDRLNDFLGNLLQLLRPTMKDLKPDSPARLVENVLAVAESRMISAGIELSYQVTPDLPLVPMNAALLHRALFNIVENAIDAMPGGGSLRIALRSMADGRSVRIDIEDSGEGIPDEVGELVFRSFFTTKPHGTGLGLAIAQQIITEGHDGRIWFESSSAHGGTVFHIELPGASGDSVQRGRNFATGA